MKFNARIEEYWNDIAQKTKWYWHLEQSDLETDDYLDGYSDSLEDAKGAIHSASQKIKTEAEPTIVEWEFEL